MDTNKIIDDLVAHRFARFETKDISKFAGYLFKDMERLVKEPEEVRKQFIGDPESGSPDCGLIEKKREQGDTDSKFFFHYRPDLFTQLNKRGTDTERYTSLFQASKALYGQLVRISEKIIIDLDYRYPQFRIANNYWRMESTRRHLLRILWYKPGNEVLADAHEDRSLLTLHFADSRPGLMLEGQEKPVITEPGILHAFFGVKAGIHSGNTLTPMPHYVKSDDSSEARMAIVFFTHTFIEQGEVYVTEIVNKRKEKLKLVKG
ncbi:MAG: 2OG-Fe(II) oxygenase family protein [Candidatus Pacebacteria bacterium]|nr:2OG-Fe(II) oxygenase family protein [Candidatus Paceibacterota bacterium]